MRKALVNEVIHSFCYGCRNLSHESYWPAIVFGNKTPSKYLGAVPNCNLVPFVAYAFTKQENYIIANRHVILLATWLNSFTDEEQTYALYILNKYYVNRTNSTISNQSNISGYEQQVVSNSPELSEYD
jgi:hypothetical protein